MKEIVNFTDFVRIQNGVHKWGIRSPLWVNKHAVYVYVECPLPSTIGDGP